MLRACSSLGRRLRTSSWEGRIDVTLDLAAYGPSVLAHLSMHSSSNCHLFTLRCGWHTVCHVHVSSAVGIERLGGEGGRAVGHVLPGFDAHNGKTA